MSDRIVLHDMRFEGRHGVLEVEQREPQPFEVDLEFALDLQPAGIDDDLEKTIDYGAAFDVVRQIVESTSYRLIEALAEAIAHEMLARFPAAREVTVRIRKPEAPIDGTFGWAGVEIVRRAEPRRRRRR
jgi:7,8-dihydroneopterin aldolase/epimerase/oxygenase